MKGKMKGAKSMPGFRKLPHLQQSHAKRNCGATCLAMLFQYYGKKGTLADITRNVSRELLKGVPICKTDLIIKEAWNKGFGCCGVSAKEIDIFIPYCLENKFEIFLLYHPIANNPSAHFVLVSYCDDKFVYVNNPDEKYQSGQNRPLSFEFLRNNMKAEPSKEEIKYDNTVILLSPPNLNPDIRFFEFDSGAGVFKIPIFELVYDKINAVVDPFNDAWIVFNKAEKS